jgi:hypothetical protein
MKILGLSIWTWMLGVLVLGSVPWLAPKLSAIGEPMPLEIVKDAVWTEGGKYQIRGQLHNPRKKAARGIEISYQLTIGEVMEQNSSKKTRGTAVTAIQYVPPGATVDFIAYSDSPVFKFQAADKQKAVIRELGEK